METQKQMLYQNPSNILTALLYYNKLTTAKRMWFYNTKTYSIYLHDDPTPEFCQKFDVLKVGLAMSTLQIKSLANVNNSIYY